MAPSLLIRFFFVTALVASSAFVFATSTLFVGDHVSQSKGSTRRTLLQAKQSCSVDFKSLDYSTLISKCKGPSYPASACCHAFKEFACPYAKQINDLSTDCASMMFSYINLYGKYPPGLFASLCREANEGFSCAGYS